MKSWIKNMSRENSSQRSLREVLKLFLSWINLHVLLLLPLFASTCTTGGLVTKSEDGYQWVFKSKVVNMVLMATSFSLTLATLDLTVNGQLLKAWNLMISKKAKLMLP